MAGKWPKIRSREVSKVSPWMSIMAREVEFARDAEPRSLSRGRAGRLRVDRRRDAGRPLSAGAPVSPDAGGLHLGAAVRDGRSGRRCRGDLPPRTAGGNRLHHRVDQAASATVRPARAGSTTASMRSSSRPASRLPNRSPASPCGWCTPRELARMIRAGEFVSQLHVGSLMLAELYGLIELPKLAPAPWLRVAKTESAAKRKARVRQPRAPEPVGRSSQSAIMRSSVRSIARHAGCRATFVRPTARPLATDVASTPVLRRAARRRRSAA